MPHGNEQGGRRSHKSKLRNMRIARALGAMDKRPLIVAGMAALACLSVVYSFSPRSYELTAGVVAKSSVYAPRDQTWHDEEATEAARVQAARDVVKVYNGQRPQAFQEMVQRSGAIFEVIDATAASVRIVKEEQVSDEMDGDSDAPAPPPDPEGEEPGPVEDRIEMLIRDSWDLLDPERRPSFAAFDFAVRMEPDDRTALREACQRALSRLNEEREFRSDELTDALAVHGERLDYWARVRALGIPDVEGVRDSFVEICGACIVPNSILDLAATEAERERVVEEVQPLMESVKQGEVLVSQGKLVTDEDMKRLQAFGMVADSDVTWASKLPDLGMAILSLTALLVVIFYFEPESIRQTRKLAALALLVSIPAIAFNVMVNEDNLPHVGYAVAQFAVLAATLLLGHFTAACLSGALLVFFMLVAGPSSLHGMLGVLAGAVAGMICARHLTYRYLHVAVLGLASSVFAFAAVGFADMYLDRRLSVSGQAVYTADILLQARWAVFAGLAGVLGGALASRALEHSLETVTDMRLLELSDPSHPLLETLLLKAPGTYHGSWVVSNIAASAAKSIGRDHDALLVRVGALYHDVGKTERPHMFVENQGGRGNPHDGLSPTMSALSIISHVNDGVKLAEKHRLPRPIVDCIKEHHGTTLVAYFFHRAKELKLEGISEQQFRYPGPRPRSVATGILMLADTVEAAVRALPKPTRHAIEVKVGEVVAGKIADGQLDECPLTMREIKAVQASLVKTVLGIYHARIEYPSDSDSEAPKTDAGPAQKKPRAEGGEADGP